MICPFHCIDICTDRAQGNDVWYAGTSEWTKTVPMECSSGYCVLYCHTASIKKKMLISFRSVLDEAVATFNCIISQLLSICLSNILWPNEKHRESSLTHKEVHGWLLEWGPELAIHLAAFLFMKYCFDLKVCQTVLIQIWAFDRLFLAFLLMNHLSLSLQGKQLFVASGKIWTFKWKVGFKKICF